MAGVGKTRLVRELLRRCTSPDSARFVVATTAAQELPLGAFLSTLSPSSLLGAVSSSLFSYAFRELRTAAEESDQVLAVDDAHLLDELSALLVQQLVLAGAPVVLSVRSGMPCSDAITSLWKDGVLDRLEVQPLAHDDLTELVETVLGSPLESGSAERLWRATGGNALFVHELVIGARASGALKKRAGVWRLDANVPVSSTLREQVEQRMRSMDHEVREVLELLALAEPLSGAVIGDIVSNEAVEAAETEGLVVWSHADAQSTVRLSHPMFGEAVRAQMRESAVQRIYRRLFDIVRDRPLDGPDDVLRRAIWVDGSDDPVTPDRAVTLVMGAQVGVLSRDFGLAERLARRALRVASSVSFEADFVIAQSARWMGRLDEADAMYASLFDRAETDTQRVRVLNVRAFGLFFELGRETDAEVFLRHAEQTSAGDMVRLLVASIRATFALYRGETEGSLRQAVSVLMREDAPRAAWQWAATTAVLAAASVGRARDAELALERLSLLEERQMQSAFELALSALARHDWLVMQGQLDRAENEAMRYHASIVGSRDFVDIAVAELLIADSALARGRPLAAMRWAREGLSQEKIGTVGDIPARIGCILAIAGAQAGDRGAQQDGLAMIGEIPGRFPRSEPYALIAQSWAAASADEHSRARTLALRAAERADEMSQHAVALSAAYQAFRFGALEEGDMVAAAARRVDGDLAASAAHHVEAWREGDGDALLEVSSVLEELGYRLHAADVAAHASMAFGKTGRHASSRAAATRAQQLRAQCDNAQTPALAQLDAPTPLTGREREVVALAARGLSNREIADRLVVNVRTVEGHLNRAFAKIGVTNRHELEDVLRVV